VEGGFEVSAALLINLQAALVTAHKAVMFPMAPIYDPVEVNCRFNF
jgi:hypothetical protein